MAAREGAFDEVRGEVEEAGGGVTGEGAAVAAEARRPRWVDKHRYAGSSRRHTHMPQRTLHIGDLFLFSTHRLTVEVSVLFIYLFAPRRRQGRGANNLIPHLGRGPARPSPSQTGQISTRTALPLRGRGVAAPPPLRGNRNIQRPSAGCRRALPPRCEVRVALVSEPVCRPRSRRAAAGGRGCLPSQRRDSTSISRRMTSRCRRAWECREWSAAA